MKEKFIAGIRKATNQPNKDRLLIVVLFFFNVWSGATTVIGASQVLPKQLAWLSGIAVQTMLFFLLAGWVMKHSFLRKWLAILMFSVFSVYTSFFCYYDVLIGDVRSRDIRTQSVEAHQQLVATVFTPILEKERQLKQDYEKLKRKETEECESGLTTGQVGCGAAAREFNKQAIEVKSQQQSINELIKRLSPAFNYSLEKLTAEEIFKRDIEAFSSVPSQYLPSGFTVKKETYLPKVYDVNFLTPYYKVFDSKYREDSAIFAMIIALCIDGIAIVQGTAIEKRERKRSLLQMLTIRLTQFITEVKTLLFEVKSASKRKQSNAKDYNEVNRFIVEANSCISELPHDIVQKIVFAFSGSIKPSPPHTIDMNKLQESQYSSDNRQYDHSTSVLENLLKLLGILEKNNFLLNSNNLRENSESSWQIRDDRYSDFVDWLDSCQHHLNSYRKSYYKKDEQSYEKFTEEDTTSESNENSDGWQRVINDFKNF